MQPTNSTSHAIPSNLPKSKKGEHITQANIADLIRTKLKAFKPTKFSVQTRGNSISITWTDGPTISEIESLTNIYQTNSFDSSIDYQYHVSLWLLPDGTAQIARDPGTEDCRGFYPKINNPKPTEDTILLQNYSDTWIRTSRQHSPQIYQRAIEVIKQQKFQELDQIPWDEIHFQDIPGGTKIQNLPDITVGLTPFNELLRKTVRGLKCA